MTHSCLWGSSLLDLSTLVATCCMKHDIVSMGCRPDKVDSVESNTRVHFRDEPHVLESPPRTGAALSAPEPGYHAKGEQMQAALQHEGQATQNRRVSTKPQNAAPQLMADFAPVQRGGNSQHVQMQAALQYEGQPPQNRRVSTRPQNAVPELDPEYAPLPRGGNSRHEQMQAALQYEGQAPQNRRVSSKPQNFAPELDQDYSHVPRGGNSQHEQMQAALQYAGQAPQNHRMSTKPQNAAPELDPDYSHVPRGGNSQHEQMRVALQYAGQAPQNRRMSTKPQNAVPELDPDYSHVPRGGNSQHEQMQAALQHEGQGPKTRRVSSKPQNMAPELGAGDVPSTFPDHDDQMRSVLDHGMLGTTQQRDLSQPQNAPPVSPSNYAVTRSTSSSQIGLALNHGYGSAGGRSAGELAAARQRFPFAYSARKGQEEGASRPSSSVFLAGSPCPSRSAHAHPGRATMYPTASVTQRAQTCGVCADHMQGAQSSGNATDGAPAGVNLSSLRREVDELSTKYAPSSTAPFATHTNSRGHVSSHGGMPPRQFPWSMS